MKLPRLPVLEGWKKRAAYGAFFALAFLLALQRTFPADAVRERLTLEAAAQGWQVRMNDIAPSGFAGVRMSEVTLESRDGTRIPLEQARLSLRLWPLLLGRRSLAFDLQIFQGRLTGVVETGSSAQRLALRGQGIDLAQAGPLKQALGGLDLSGVLRADLDVTIDTKDSQKSSGRIEVAVERAGLGGQVSLPGMSGGLTLPKASLGNVTGQATVRAGKAEFEKLEARGGDLEATGEQLYFMVQPRLEFAPLFGRARLKVVDAFWQRAPALRPLADAALASARRPDGSWQFQIYGSLGHPQAKAIGTP
ncbi:MAG TPA: type II secretion system protein GspN [Anaeromyxobacteraceae bacterium]|nr:type II secretion system protein GspN [Anaeromyxobacteraceae bacterium]